MGYAQGLFQPMRARHLDNNSSAAKSKQTLKPIILRFISVKMCILLLLLYPEIIKDQHSNHEHYR